MLAIASLVCELPGRSRFFRGLAHQTCLPLITPHTLMAVDELPAPSRGGFLEVSFRRLLASCEEIVAGDNKCRADLANWQRSPVFHHVRRAAGGAICSPPASRERSVASEAG